MEVADEAPDAEPEFRSTEGAETYQPRAERSGALGIRTPKHPKSPERARQGARVGVETPSPLPQTDKAAGAPRNCAAALAASTPVASYDFLLWPGGSDVIPHLTGGFLGEFYPVLPRRSTGPTAIYLANNV